MLDQGDYDILIDLDPVDDSDLTMKQSGKVAMKNEPQFAHLYSQCPNFCSSIDSNRAIKTLLAILRQIQLFYWIQTTTMKTVTIMASLHKRIPLALLRSRMNGS
jgi:hypothetical protein